MADLRVSEPIIRAGDKERAVSGLALSPANFPALHRLSLITAASTFLLIVAGALVVGNEAGLAVPDWPLSFGTWMPPMVGGVFYEHGHRMIAGAVGLLTVALALWLWFAEPRRWVRRLGWVAVAAVILQAILGGITVLYKLPPAVVIGHACLAQAFFCLTLSLAVFTGRRWNVELPLAPDSLAPSFRQLTATTSLVLFLQLALGAGLRHQVTNVIPHLIGAMAVCLMVGWVIWRVMTLPEQKPLQQLGISMGFLLILQVGLGGLSYFTRLVQLERSHLDAVMIWTTSAHVAVGALLLGTSWVLTLYAFRRMAPASAVSPFRHSPQKSPA